MCGPFAEPRKHRLSSVLRFRVYKPHHSWTDVVVKHLIKVRKLFYISIALITIGFNSCNKETILQITDVKISPDTLYNQNAQRFLGKELHIVFYDKSVKLFIDGQASHILRLYPSGDYLGESYSLSLSKKYGIVDSAVLSINEYPINPPFERTITLKAKR